jgi:tetratricopeptide (TPR) repeat protein
VKHLLYILTLYLYSGNATATAVTTAIDTAIRTSRSANEYFETGISQSNQGKYEEAIRNFTRAIAMDGTHIYYQYHRGLTYKAMGNKAMAMRDFNHCNAMKPIAEAYYELGVIKYEAFDIFGAKADFEKARELKEDVERVNFYLGVIMYRMNAFDTATSLLCRYLRTVKSNSDAYLFVGLCYVKQKKYNEARPFLQLASLYNNNDWQLHLKMYEIYREMGDKENMLYNISMVIELGETKPEYYAIRAKLYTEMGDALRAKYDFIAARGERQTP